MRFDEISNSKGIKEIVNRVSKIINRVPIMVLK